MMAAPTSRWLDLGDDLQRCVEGASLVRPTGRLVRANGLLLEAEGFDAALGAIVEMGEVQAEVVGFDNGRLMLMASGETSGLAAGASVTSWVPEPSPPRWGMRGHPWQRSGDRGRHLPIGPGLVGRVVDPHGQPLDSLGPLSDVVPLPIAGRPINAMQRAPIRTPLDTGTRTINALLTVGRGQRMGLFAGAGVGKSVLMGMMARHTAAHVTVVGLIGERGREVREFIEDILGPEGLKSAVVVAAPADQPPLCRMQAAVYATAIAEHLRDAGADVLLLMDSLTRYALAAREIALATGEPPATKGYPPSVFARLPQLVERAGNGPDGRGSITAFYTVLTEGDDPNDPVADAARAILDGHLVLSRTLAQSGHFPAIDVGQSISRVMHSIVGPDHLALARDAVALWSAHAEARDLIAVGAYAPGSDPVLDRALAILPALRTFLRQAPGERATMDVAVSALAAALRSGQRSPA